jgi:hypothetical protein
MTSPLEQKIRITGPSIITANRTFDGAVIYRNGSRGWSTDLSEAVVVRTADAARALLAESVADDIGAVGPYIAPVEVRDDGKISLAICVSGSGSAVSPSNFRFPRKAFAPCTHMTSSTAPSSTNALRSFAIR